jgi:hypothetical protein
MFGPELLPKLLLLSLSCAWDSKVWEKIDRRIRQFAYEISSHYQSDFRYRHGNIKVSGTQTDLEIEKIYVPVRCTNNLETGYKSISDIGKNSRYEFNTGDKESKPHENESLFLQVNKNQYLILVGQVGAGKTIALKYIALEALKQDESCRYEHHKIPVYLDLNNYLYKEKHLQDIIVNEFFIADVPDSIGFTNETLKRGDLLILIDSIDDLNQKQQIQRISEIRDFVERFPKNRYILARKELIGTSHLVGFRIAFLKPFKTLEIKTFIQNWFNKKQRKIGLALLEEVKNNASFPYDLCCNPLLLTRICILFSIEGNSPINLVHIHENALKVLLIDWPREKGDSASDNLAYFKEEALSGLALTMFQQPDTITLRIDLLDRLEVQKQKNFKDPFLLSPSQLLYDFEYRHGILHGMNDGSYKFTFYSMKEFLAAYGLIFTSQYLEGFIISNFLDPRWKNVFILAAGLTNADGLVTSMLDYINFFCLTPRLRKIVTWAEATTQNFKDFYRDSTKVAYALYMLLEVVATYQKDCGFQTSLFSINRKIRDLFLLPSSDLTSSYLIDPKLIKFLSAKTLVDISKSMIQRGLSSGVFLNSEKIQVFYNNLLRLEEMEKSKQLGSLQREKCLDFLYRNWISVLNIDSGDIKFSLEDVYSLRSYLYGYDLILKCVHYSRQVSPQACLNINRMFMAISESNENSLIG